MTEKNGEVNGVDHNDNEPGSSSSSSALPQSHNNNVGASSGGGVDGGGGGGEEEETSALSSIVEQERSTTTSSTVEVVSHQPVRQSTTTSTTTTTNLAGQKQDILASTHVSRQQVSDLQNQKMRIIQDQQQQPSATTKEQQQQGGIITSNNNTTGIKRLVGGSSAKTTTANGGTDIERSDAELTGAVVGARASAVAARVTRETTRPGAIHMTSRPIGVTSSRISIDNDDALHENRDLSGTSENDNAGTITATAISPHDLEQEVLGRIMDRAITAVAINDTNINININSDDDHNAAMDPSKEDDNYFPTKNERIKIIIVRTILVILVIVALIVSASISRRNRRRNDERGEETLSDTPPTFSPTEIPLTSKQLIMLEFLLNISTWDGASDALMDRSSPQFRAFWWLSNDSFVNSVVGNLEFDDEFEEENNSTNTTTTETGSFLRQGRNDTSSSELPGTANVTEIESLQSLYARSLYDYQDIIVPRYALATLFYSTDGPTMWVEKQNWLSNVTICEWYTSSLERTICDMNGDLTRLEIRDNGLRGQLVTELVLLTSLNTLLLADNDLTGSLPSDWILNGHSNFTQSLVELDLSNNIGLTGDVTDILWNLLSLTSLRLAHLPNVTAILTSEMGRLSNLNSFIAPGMMWMGSLPTEIGLWREVRSINLPSNVSMVNGSIPMELWELPRLDDIDLSGLGLTGTLPDFDDSDAVPRLRVLRLGQNALQGRLPPSLGLMTSLQELQLQDNEFGVGLFLPDEEDLDNMIPTEMGGLTNLEVLNLTNNPGLGIPPSVSSGSSQAVTNSIPSEFGSLTRLAELGISNCALTSTLPTELGLLTSLTLLRANDNMLAGTVPSEVGVLTALTELSIASNTFIEGVLPSELGLLTNLKMLNLAGPRRPPENRRPPDYRTDYSFNGTLPQTFTYLTSLEYLNLGYNKISGTFPQTTFLSMTNMKYFAAKDNKWVSSLPSAIGEAFSKLGMFHSLMNIEIFMHVCGAPDLLNSSILLPLPEYFDIAHNQITGIFKTEVFSQWTELGKSSSSLASACFVST